MTRFRILASLATAIVLMTSPGAAAQTAVQPPLPSLEDTLRLAGAALEEFSRDAAGVVYEEDYVQQANARMLSTRRLRSDVLIMSDSAHGWLEFRDVFEVDKKPVRDRDDRLVKLFAHPSDNAAEQARRIVAEGARFNLDSEALRVTRTLNLPTITLLFLRTEAQPRSTFTLSGLTTIAGQRVAIVMFRETSRPRLIASPNDAAAGGTFWIDPETGHVLRSELVFTSQAGTTQVTATVKVDFRLETRLKLWLPYRMEERYNGSAPGMTLVGSIDGQALYSKFRKFDVAVEERTN